MRKQGRLGDPETVLHPQAGVSNSVSSARTCMSSSITSSSVMMPMGSPGVEMRGTGSAPCESSPKPAWPPSTSASDGLALLLKRQAHRASSGDESLQTMQGRLSEKLQEVLTS